MCFFFLTEFKVKKCKQNKLTEKQKNKHKRTRKTIPVQLLSASVISGVNFARTDRVTPDWCGEHFWFLFMLKDYCGFSLNPALFKVLHFKPTLET